MQSRINLDSRKPIMSNISNRHTVNSFVAGKSEPLNGQRLVRVLYKPRGNKPAQYPSVCVSVPPMDTAVWNTESGIKRIAPYFNTYLESVQDKIVKSLYESKDGHLSSVGDSEISFDAICAFLESETTGGRLTKESIEQWFDAQMKDNLTVIFADKMRLALETDEEIEKVTQQVNAYRASYASLSASIVNFGSAQLVNLSKALDISNVDDDMSQKLRNRITNLQKPIEVASMIDL